MRSSTSSSDVSGSWGRTWLLALMLAALVLGWIELAFRERGFDVAVHDSPARWAIERERASGATRSATVILGSSRTQFGIRLDTFARESGGTKPIQLSLQGGSPLPVLRDLAEDESFAGLVLVGVNERILFQANRRREIRAARHVAEGRNVSPGWTAPFEAWARDVLDSSLVFRSPQLAVSRQLVALQAGRAVIPRERWVLPDRSARIDLERVDARALANRWKSRLRSERPPGDRVRDAIIDELAIAADVIRARGGEVVLLRMPSSGELLRLENQRFPRSRFWDVLVERSGLPAIHFSDQGGRLASPTPDESHIDLRDMERFTIALVEVLAERGLIPSRPRSRVRSESR